MPKQDSQKNSARRSTFAERPFRANNTTRPLNNINSKKLFFSLAYFSMNIHLTLNTFRIKYLNNVRALKRNLTLNKEILMATKKKAKKKATKKKAKKKATKKKAKKKAKRRR